MKRKIEFVKKSAGAEKRNREIGSFFCYGDEENATCLRHTFATNCIESGMEPKTLQKILGHNSMQMTMDLYCHVRESTLTDEMERIANFM